MTSRTAQLAFDLQAHVDGFEEAYLPNEPASAQPGSRLITRICNKLSSDEHLANRLQRGDTDGLTILYERHCSLLFGIARRILRNDAEAEDAVQQIFLDVFRAIGRYDPEKAPFKTWLLLFAYHRTFNSRRALSASRFFDTHSLEDTDAGLQHNPSVSPRFSSTESTILIAQLLRSLQPRQRRTIELIYYEGLTAEEVSARTGETVRVVRHNLYRGLHRLRLALAASERTSQTQRQGEAR